MPIYDYKCVKCENIYDIFHKVREVVEDVICPSCGSPEYQRLISAPSVNMNKTPSSCPMPSGGGCAGGMCGLN